MKAFMNWSGGKDSSLALYHILKNKHLPVEKLLTTVNNEYRRVSMHGVREDLLEQQASSIGIPLLKLALNDQPSMEEYEKQMEDTIKQLQNEKFTHSIFGDIFLQDLRIYRETQLAKVGITPVFPLWERNTIELIYEFIRLGFKTIIVCVNEKYLDKSFCGRIINEKFMADLPADVDACGENGEFHTFVFDGPIFNKPVPFNIGETVYRKYAVPKREKDNCFKATKDDDYGFYFCDLLPA